MDKRIQKEFTDIYEERRWGNNPLSGPGSTHEVTAPLLPQVCKLLRDREIKSIIDVGCGDASWISQIPWHDMGIKYLGCDIVHQLIEDCQAKYTSQNMRFCVRDAATSQIPRYDLIIWRDVAIHLTNEEVNAAISKFRASGSKYLLATTFPETLINTDIVTGDWRILNMTMEPFDLGEPVCILPEFSPDGNYLDKSLGLWDLGA